MTTIERKNATRSRQVAILGTVIIHVILLSYMFYASSPEGEGLIESMKKLMVSTDSDPKA